VLCADEKARPTSQSPCGAPQFGLCASTCSHMHVVRKSNLLRTTSATDQEGVMVHSILWLSSKVTSSRSARDGFLNFGTARLPLASTKTIHEPSPRHTAAFWSESFRNNGSPPPNVVPGRLLWLLGKPCYHIRTAHTTSGCSDLLRELSFTHSTKPNFPAVGKNFKCLTECASHRLKHIVVYRYLLPLLVHVLCIVDTGPLPYSCIPLLRCHPDSTGNHEQQH
jgi:hypothetical protein